MSASSSTSFGGACVCAQEQATDAAGLPNVPDTAAVIVAGGSGERFGDPRGKQFVDLCGLPLLCWSVMAFDRAPSIERIIIVCAPDKVNNVQQDVLSRLTLRCPVELAPAGDTRQASSLSGLSRVPRDLPFVAIHDAARPLVEVEMIERACACVRQNPELAGAICASRCIDTLKLVEGTDIVATPDRTIYWAAQTPQVFRLRAVMAAHKAAVWDSFSGTDDASLVERHGGRVRCVECSRDNLKVTIPEDLALAQATLEQRLIDEGCGTTYEGDN